MKYGMDDDGERYIHAFWIFYEAKFVHCEIRNEVTFWKLHGSFYNNNKSERQPFEKHLKELKMFSNLG